VESLFDRIGGDVAVARLVEAFYDRVLADPELAPFFAVTPMEKLVRMQHEYFAAALGGPEAYSGSALRAAHAGRAIGQRHYARFAGHLLDTLDEMLADPDDIAEITNRLTIHTDDILGDATIDG
jgi:hemoglobin